MGNGRLWEEYKRQLEGGNVKPEDAALMNLALMLDLYERVTKVEEKTILWLLRHKTIQTLAAIAALNLIEDLLLRAPDLLRSMLALPLP